jgi:hypothetical protein
MREVLSTTTRKGRYQTKKEAGSKTMTWKREWEEIVMERLRVTVP